MTGSTGFLVKRAESFELGVKDILFGQYAKGRKGNAGRRDFVEKLNSLVAPLCSNPSGYPEEPWPGDPIPGWEFRKARFFLPRLKAAASLGRLMYLVHPERRLAVLLLIYTHEEFVTRPSDDALRTALHDLFMPGKADL